MGRKKQPKKPPKGIAVLINGDKHTSVDLSKTRFVTQIRERLISATDEEFERSMREAPDRFDDLFNSYNKMPPGLPAIVDDGSKKKH